MGLARHIVFPKSENKFDRHFFDFFLLSLKDGTTVWLPPNLKDLRYYDYRDYLVGTEIYTPKGSVSERFFKSYTFPKSVKNGFPIIDGERIIPNDTTMIWFDADGTKRIIKESEKHSSFRTILYALVGFSIAVVLFGLLAHFIK